MNIQANFFTHSDEREISLDEEAIVVSNIPKKLLAHEKELLDTKWFDYRFMTPFQATMKYVDAFVTIGRMIYRREIDLERSQHIAIMSSATVMRKLKEGAADTQLKSALTGYWRGRQVADALGMQYEDYIHHAMSNRMRMWQRTYLPQPRQLYDSEIVEKVQAAWIEMKEASFYYADHHAYLLENYTGLPCQNNYHEFLFEQARATTNEHFHIARFLREGLLPYAKVEARFDAETLERISSFIE